MYNKRVVFIFSDHTKRYIKYRDFYKMKEIGAALCLKLGGPLFNYVCQKGKLFRYR